MGNKIWLVGAGVATLATVWAGCSSSNGGGTGNATTTHTGTTTTTGHGGSGTGGSSTGGSSTGGSSTGGMTTATNPFECTVPSTPASGGSCVTTVAANDAGTGIECNPVTNAGCSNGDYCDINTDTDGMTIIGFACFQGPATAKVCATCDYSTPSTTCAGGMTCYPDDAMGDTVCAQFCCTDADCGSGKCRTKDSSNTSYFGPVAPNLGLCTAM